MTEMYGSYSDEDLNEWERMPQNIRVLTSSAFGSWLLRRDKRIKERETKTGRWIPVSERLPEDIKPVIVTYKNNDPESYYQHIAGKHFIGVAHYLKGKWFWYSSTTEDFLAEYGRYDGEEFDEAIEVVAWQPLPPSYQGE